MVEGTIGGQFPTRHSYHTGLWLTALDGHDDVAQCWEGVVPVVVGGYGRMIGVGMVEAEDLESPLVRLVLRRHVISRRDAVPVILFFRLAGVLDFHDPGHVPCSVWPDDPQQNPAGLTGIGRQGVCCDGRDHRVGDGDHDQFPGPPVSDFEMAVRRARDGMPAQVGRLRTSYTSS